MIFLFRKKMKRVIYCRSLCLTAQHISETNVHLFELEDDLVLHPNDTVMAFSRNAAPYSQSVYKYHDLCPTSKMFNIGLNVMNKSSKIITLKKNTLLKKLVHMPGMKYTCHVTNIKDICRAETDTHKRINSFTHLYR